MPDAVFDAGLVERAAQAALPAFGKTCPNRALPAACPDCQRSAHVAAEAVLAVVAPRLHAAGYEQARQKFAVPTMLYNEGHAAGKAEGVAEATRTHRAAVEAHRDEIAATASAFPTPCEAATYALDALAEVLRVIGGDDGD